MVVRIYDSSKNQQQVREGVVKVKLIKDKNIIEVYTDSNTPILYIKDGWVECYSQLTDALYETYEVFLKGE